MPVVLDLRPLGDGEAQVGENLGELVHHLADRVDRARAAFARRKGQVDLLGRQPPLQLGIFQRLLPAPRSPRSPPRAARGSWAPRPCRASASIWPSDFSSCGDLARLAQRGGTHRIERSQDRRAAAISALETGAGAGGRTRSFLGFIALAGLSRIGGKCKEVRMATAGRHLTSSGTPRPSPCFTSPARCSASCGSPMRHGPIMAGM